MLRRPMLGPLILRNSAALRRSDCWHHADLVSLQNQKLNNLLKVVESNAGFIREYYDQKGVNLKDIDIVSKIHLLPVLNKRIIKESGDNFLLSKHRLVPKLVSWTGGSTGEPLKVTKNLTSAIMGEASLLRFRCWHGIGIGSRGVVVKLSGNITILGRVGQYLDRAISLNAFHGKTCDWKKTVQRLHRWQPEYLTGYPSTLESLAIACKPGLIRSRKIVVTGETLLPEQRELFEQVFGGCVVRYYGSNEVSALGFECEHGRLHVKDRKSVV